MDFKRSLLALLVSVALATPVASHAASHALGKGMGKAMDTGPSCKAKHDCKKGSYCAKATGDCNGDGKCRPQPAACLQVWDPVCGCDGKTHSNSSCAAVAGTNVDHTGECK